MKTYIALLRGINVSGHKIILMTDLKDLFEKIGFANIKTYIQSGNVVFKTKKSSMEWIRKNIEQNLFSRFGFEVKVIVKSLFELCEILDHNPFPENKLKDKEKIYLSLLSQIPEKEKINELEKFNKGPDEFNYINGVVYILCRNGYGKSLLSNTNIEKKLKVFSTTRNLDTMKKLYELASNI